MMCQPQDDKTYGKRGTVQKIIKHFCCCFKCNLLPKSPALAKSWNHLSSEAKIEDGRPFFLSARPADATFDCVNSSGHAQDFSLQLFCFLGFFFFWTLVSDYEMKSTLLLLRSIESVTPAWRPVISPGKELWLHLIGLTSLLACCCGSCCLNCLIPVCVFLQEQN